MSGERSSGNNLIEGNIVTGGNIGFFVEEANNNTFIDNQAIDNTFAGLYLGDSRGHVLRGNMARGNGVGFRVSTEGTSLTGNRALRNVDAGFKTWGQEIHWWRTEPRGTVARDFKSRSSGPGTRASIATWPGPMVATVLDLTH